jgi:hypothetical protein
LSDGTAETWPANTTIGYAAQDGRFQNGVTLAVTGDAYWIIRESA